MLTAAGPAVAASGCTWQPESVGLANSVVVGADSTNGYVGVEPGLQDRVSVWRAGRETDLGTPPASGGYAPVTQFGLDVTSDGVVVANTSDYGSVQGQASVHENGAWHVLPVPAGFSQAGARAINEHGDIAGTVWKPDHQGGRAVVWPSGARDAVRFLETPAGNETVAAGIDEAGNVVGGLRNADYSTDGVLWSPSGALVSRVGSSTSPYRAQRLADIAGGVAVGKDETGSYDTATMFTLTAGGVRTDLAGTSTWWPTASGPNGLVTVLDQGTHGVGGVLRNGVVERVFVSGGQVQLNAVAGDGTVGGTTTGPFGGQGAIWHCA
ncbi:hypothetical protein ACIOD2_32625 [Amycolatopsis sp. NPDC088138]|uniref:hypothetical protein n=1 Tax=Amycolatopsis sp. NPDC088138 TaxID=3363938 RepID=UPI003825C043